VHTAFSRYRLVELLGRGGLRDEIEIGKVRLVFFTAPTTE
jgi:hypothetical protein